ncbi:hypothetical protein ACF0H5_022883 [Mactra antiquata]
MDERALNIEDCIKMFRSFGLILLSVLIIGTNCLDLGGGAAGDNGDEFLDGTANKDKLIIGGTCVRDDVDATMGKVELRVYHYDENFAFSDDSFYMTGDGVEYETCFFIDQDDYEANKDITLTSCAEFAKEDASSAFSSQSYQSRLLYKEASINFDDTTDLYCGADYDGGNSRFEYAVYCKREAGHDYLFDVIFTVLVSNNKDDCLVEEITSTKVTSKNPRIISMDRELEVSSTLYVYDDDDFDNIGGPVAPPGDIVTVPVDLGSNLIWEICLIIPNSNGPNVFYFKDDGVRPIGLYLFDCHATPDTTGGNAVNEGANPKVVDSNGCGLQTLPINQFAPDTYIFQFVKDPDGELDHWMRTPNCFRSRGWEGIRFGIKDVLNDGTYHLQCKVEYCTSLTDQRCFGTGTNPGDSYDGMCGGAKRKKRQAAENFSYLPDDISVTIQFTNKTKQAKDVGCFQKTTYIGISSALGFLSLVVLIVVSFLGLRLYHYDDDENNSRTTSSTMTGSKTNSMSSGIRNKAYI